MFNKPYDLVIMFSIIAAVVITIGFGIDSVENYGGTVENKTFFTNANLAVDSTNYTRGTLESSTNALQGGEGAAQDTNEQSIIADGFAALLSLPKTYHGVSLMLQEGQEAVGIPPVYLVLLMGTILFTMFVVVYSWFRGDT